MAEKTPVATVERAPKGSTKIKTAATRAGEVLVATVERAPKGSTKTPVGS